MPKVNIRSATCVERAIELYKKHPTFSVPQMIKLADFPANDQDDHAVRMCTYCRIKKWNIVPQQTDVFKTPLFNEIDVARFQGTLSSVTSSLSAIP
jgi:hypothetical protein